MNEVQNIQWPNDKFNKEQQLINFENLRLDYSDDEKWIR
jgi:hypothetical protein